MFAVILNGSFEIVSLIVTDVDTGSRNHIAPGPTALCRCGGGVADRWNVVASFLTLFPQCLMPTLVPFRLRYLLG